MSKLLSLVLIFAVALAKVDPYWWRVNKSSLKKDYFKEFVRNDLSYEDALSEKEIQKLDTHNQELAQQRVDFLEKYLNDPRFDDFTFKEILGRGSYGMVFSAEGLKGTKYEDFTIKMMWESDPKNLEAENSYRMYSALEDAGVPYLISTEEPFCSTDSKKGLILCGIMMERALPVTKPMFAAAVSAEQREENTVDFIRFAIRTLYGFSIMHFQAKYLHADIKPDNLMYIKTAQGEIKPRIIDFDLTFNRRKLLNPGFLTYTPDFRPPELLAIAPTNHLGGAGYKKLRAYVYDSEFKEDAYALGLTLQKILRINEPLLKLGSGRVEALKGILKAMTQTSLSLRINTKEAYERALELDIVEPVKQPQTGMTKWII